ncbi:MAG: tetratricopeptide repeat protein, partial [Comamonas sp.]
RDVVERMLRNLQEIHLSQRDWPMLVAVLNRLLLLRPEMAELYRDRGLAYAEWGVADRALLDLERYAQTAQGQEAVFIEKTMENLRKEG